MKNWSDLVSNPQSLHTIYDTEPKLENIELVSVHLLRHAGTVEITWLTEDIPQHPPKKWLVSGLARVSITISLIDIVSLSIEGWSGNTLGQIDFQNDENAYINFSFKSSGCVINILSKFSSIVTIRPA